VCGGGELSAPTPTPPPPQKKNVSTSSWWQNKHVFLFCFVFSQIWNVLRYSVRVGDRINSTCIAYRGETSSRRVFRSLTAYCQSESAETKYNREAPSWGSDTRVLHLVPGDIRTARLYCEASGCTCCLRSAEHPSGNRGNPGVSRWHRAPVVCPRPAAGHRSACTHLVSGGSRTSRERVGALFVLTAVFHQAPPPSITLRLPQLSFLTFFVFFNVVKLFGPLTLPWIIKSDILKKHI